MASSSCVRSSSVDANWVLLSGGQGPHSTPRPRCERPVPAPFTALPAAHSMYSPKVDNWQKLVRTGRDYPTLQVQV